MKARVIKRRVEDFGKLYDITKYQKKGYYNPDYNIVGFLLERVWDTRFGCYVDVEWYPKENVILEFIKEYIRNLKKYSKRHYYNFILTLLEIINE